MALSQDEQRVLAEIERRLAAEDPRLASCLATFRRPRSASVLRSPRARIIGSLCTVLLVAVVSLMVYAMIPFRAHGARTPPSPSAASQARAIISTTGSTNSQHATRQSSAGVSGSVTDNTSLSAPNSSAAPSSKTTAARGNGTAASQVTDRSAPSVDEP
jgi:hypothetical protein